MVCSWHDTWIAHTGKRGMNGRYPGTGPVHLLALQYKGKILPVTLIRYDTWHFDILRVVPRFPSGILERAKRERVWKSPHQERRDAAGREKNEGLQTKPKLLTLHGRMILGYEVPIAFRIIGVLIAAGAFLTVVDRLPLKGQSELCVVRVTGKAKSLAFVGSPWGRMRDYTLNTKAGSLIVKIKY